MRPWFTLEPPSLWLTLSTTQLARGIFRSREEPFCSQIDRPLTSDTKHGKCIAPKLARRRKCEVESVHWCQEGKKRKCYNRIFSLNKIATSQRERAWERREKVSRAFPSWKTHFPERESTISSDGAKSKSFGSVFVENSSKAVRCEERFPSRFSR